MTLSLTPSESAKWIRALFGGALSAFVVGIALFLVHFVNSESLIYLKILELPGLILTILGSELSGYTLIGPPDSLSLSVISLALVYWFLFGFGLTYFIKNNIMAIAWWLILVIIPGIVLLMLIYSMSGFFV